MAAGFKTQPVVCFRNRQQLEQPEHIVQEETAQLLPVTKEAAAGGQGTERRTVFFPHLEAEERRRVSPQLFKEDSNNAKERLRPILSSLVLL